MNDASINQFLDLRGLFFETAAELLQALNEEGLKLEANPGNAEIRRSLRRTVHTLKGDSAAAGFPQISELAHELEDAFDDHRTANAGSALAELVLEAADTFNDLLAACRDGMTPSVPDEIRRRIRALSEGHPIPEQTSPATPPPQSQKAAELGQQTSCAASEQGLSAVRLLLTVDPSCPAVIAMEMVRGTLERSGAIRTIALGPTEQSPQTIEAEVSTACGADWFEKACRIPAVITDVKTEAAIPKADAAHVQTELDVPPQIGARVESKPQAADAPLQPPADRAERSATAQQVRENSVRVDSARIDEALNLVGELIIGKSMLMQNLSEFEARYGKDPLAGKFADAMSFQARVLSDLQKSMMKIRMVPVEQLFRRFPRMVRDVSKTCGKQVELEMSGQDTDLDKGILDVLAEPLSHLVRNAVDHGIESPEQRRAQGKPATGTVRLSAYHQANQVVTECADDGRGIDTEKLVERSIACGAITPDQVGRLTENETLALIFRPGVSTAGHVTRISGRGVGMDVVKTVVESLKGSVWVESALGKGTTIRLRVPLTLAIIKALLFRVSDRLYAVPLYSVIEVTRARAPEMHRVHEHEVITLRDEVLTLVRLEKLHGALRAREGKFFVVVIAHGERKFGLMVDQVVGEEEIVIKPLTDHLIATEFVTGASILGDGSVVLILSVQALVENLCATPMMAVEASA